MSTARKNTKAQQFIDDMIRCRGIEFARLGMMVEVDGDLGTIVGMNRSANLDVQFANQLKRGNGAKNCHPTWRTKYFDASGAVIAHFDDGGCITRPEKVAA